MSQSTLSPLDLEVAEVERKSPPGCSNSSSTNPRCTCPIPVISDR